MLPAALVLFQTLSTLCLATEVPFNATIVERRFVGCGEGHPDNLLWHLDRADSVTGELDAKLTRTITGRGSMIYVIDTGVRTEHDEFTRFSGSNVRPLDPSDEYCPIGTCFAGELGLLFYSHGTGVASVAAGRHTGIAPDASVIAATYDDQAPGLESTLLRIIAHAHAPTSPSFRTAVISISRSLVAEQAPPSLNALIARMAGGVDAQGNADANGKRFLFVAAAGNSYPGDRSHQCTESNGLKLYPAVLANTIEGVVSVGGIDRENHYWTGSCDGAEVAAPAEDIFVASSSADDTYRFQPEFYSSGTSWSAPYVSGIAALWLEVNPQLTPAQLESLLKSSISHADGVPVPLVPKLGTEPRRRAARH